MRYRWSRKPPSSFISRIFLTVLSTGSVIKISRAGAVARQAMSDERWSRQNELISHVRKVVDVSIYVLVIDQMMKS